MENFMHRIDQKEEFECAYSLNQKTKRYIFAFSSLFILLCLAYGNSLDGVWIFDDHHDILQNKIVSSFTWPDFLQQNVIKNLSRPVVVLSFVLNYRLGGYDIYSYHLFNFAVHYVSAIFIFLFVYKTMLLPSLAVQYRAYAYSIALLTAAFWCTSPVHVTVVTYITQRYTSLAGMFYFMALFFFVQGRTAGTKSAAIRQYIFCFISTTLAFFSKENAAMIPVTIYLYDLLLIRGASRENVRQDLKIAIWPLSGLLIIGILYLTTTGFPLDYSAYNFTMKERLLTEPRVILLYLSLLLYPMPSRLTLDHDYVLSTSLLNPWTTVIAILVILGLIGYSLSCMRKRPLVAFCILFFFINHVIESSIIPIEIVWEYRNYVPSLSFFILVVLFIIWAFQFFQKKKVIFFMIVGCIVFLLIAQSDTTYRRNTLFFSEKLVWIDSSLKSPGLSRPHTNLAYIYSLEGDNKKALAEAGKAVTANKHPNGLSKARMLTNLSVYQIQANDREAALKNVRYALSIHPYYDYGHAAAAILMMQKRDLKSAAIYISQALLLSPEDNGLHGKYALILFHQGKYKKALTEARKALTLNNKTSDSKMVIAEIMRQQKLYGKAILYWNDYLQSAPNDRRAILALIELYHLTNESDQAKIRLNYLLALENGNLQNLLAQKNTYDHVYAIDGKVLKPIIKKLLSEMGECCQ